MYTYYPPETKIIRRPAPGARRSADCVEHVSKGWFPVNQVLLRKLTRKIDSGYYRDHSDELVRDLQLDPALFGHCARSARAVVGQECHDFLRALKDLDRSALRTLVGGDEGKISRHRFRNATRLQALRAKQSIECSAIARTIAPEVGVPAEDAATCAFLRQLGYDLIAWNYPEIYGRAVHRAVERGVDLADQLEEMLGISPLHLARRVSSGWPIPPEITSTMEVKDLTAGGALPRAPLATERTEKLLQTAQVSEILARARDPEHFPSAVRQWDVISRDIDALLGVGGEQALTKNLEEADRPLIAVCPAAAPRIIRHPTLLDQVAHGDERSPIEENLFAKRCAPELQALFRSLYALTTGDAVSSQAVIHFVDRVVPAAGFSDGCIFLGNSTTLTVHPGLRIGARTLAFYDGLAASSHDAIVEAMFGAASIARELVWRDGRRVFALLGGIGTPHRVGVLALELPEEIASATSVDLLTRFRALRHALEDILRIR